MNNYPYNSTMYSYSAPAYPYPTTNYQGYYPTDPSVSSADPVPEGSPFQKPISENVSNFERTLIFVDDAGSTSAEDMEKFMFESRRAIDPHFWQKVHDLPDEDRSNLRLCKGDRSKDVSINTTVHGLVRSMQNSDVTSFCDFVPLFEKHEAGTKPTASTMRTRLDKDKSRLGNALGILLTNREPTEGFDKFRQTIETMQTDLKNSHMKIFVASTDKTLVKGYEDSVNGIPRVQVQSQSPTVYSLDQSQSGHGNHWNGSGSGYIAYAQAPSQWSQDPSVGNFASGYAESKRQERDAKSVAGRIKGFFK